MSDFFYKTKATSKRTLTIFLPHRGAAPPDLLLHCGVNESKIRTDVLR